MTPASHKDRTDTRTVTHSALRCLHPTLTSSAQDPRRMVGTDAQNGGSVPTVGQEAMTVCVQCPVTRDEPEGAGWRHSVSNPSSKSSVLQKQTFRSLHPRQVRLMPGVAPHQMYIMSSRGSPNKYTALSRNSKFKASEKQRSRNAENIRS